MFSCAFIIPAGLWRVLQAQRVQAAPLTSRLLLQALFAAAVVLLVFWFVSNIGYDFSLYRTFLEQESALGLFQLIGKTG